LIIENILLAETVKNNEIHKSPNNVMLVYKLSLSKSLSEFCRILNRNNTVSDYIRWCYDITQRNIN
jgi:hypothetical protein